MSCAVKHCKKIKRLNDTSTISFHRFPKDPARFLEWKNALGITDNNFTWSKTKYVCSNHFSAREIINSTNQRRLLTGSAVPSIMLVREKPVNEEVDEDSVLHENEIAIPEVDFPTKSELMNNMDFITERNADLNQYEDDISTDSICPALKERTFPLLHRKYMELGKRCYALQKTVDELKNENNYLRKVIHELSPHALSTRNFTKNTLELVPKDPLSI